MPELYIAPINKSKKFRKGFIPFNKGLKWDEFMPKEHQERILKNLLRTGRSDIGGWNAKKVVGIRNGKFCVFDSSMDAEKKTGIIARNIRKVCNKERQFAGKVKWFFESDLEWIEYYNKTKELCHN